MQITIGKTAGFCHGVQRAVSGAKEIIKNYNEKYYGLGEIVHNKEVVKELEKEGITFIENIDEAEGNVIIRAHGIPKKIYEIAKNKGINLIDFTCPKVISVHKIAEKYAKQGYYIILFGDKNHPENIGTISYCGNYCSCIKEEGEIEDTIKSIEKVNKNKVLIISQTTYSIAKFEEYSSKIKQILEEKNIEVIINNTICKSTEIRQKETEEMAKINDYMIIIGGKNSSNTQKLYEIAIKYCKNTVCIENEEELNEEEIYKYNIGIMAGASTPKESIERVKNKILKNI